MTRHIIIPDVNYGESQLVAAREAMTVQTTRFMRRRILYEGMLYCPLRHNWRMMSLLPCPYLQEGMQVKDPRPSGRGFLNQENFYSSATLRAAIPPRSSERGILADPRESGPTSAARCSRDSFPEEKRHRLVPGVRIIRQAVAAEIDGRDVWLACRETQF